MPTILTNGVETYYERRGSGPPVVFVHGAILDHSQWDPQTEELSDDYTVLAYDVRGHGRTGGSRRGSYSVELFADDLAALLDGLNRDDMIRQRDRCRDVRLIGGKLARRGDRLAPRL